MLPETIATGVNSDGSALVGILLGPMPYRRVGNGPLQSLGLLPNQTRGYANGISGDGMVVVGGCEHGSQPQALGQAFRWTPQGGMQGLGYARPNNTYSDALGISRDGSTIVGSSSTFGGDYDAFVWRQATGMQALPGLPGAPFVSNDARAVNASGSVIVGDAVAANTRGHAVLWTGSAIQDLGVLPGFLDSFAYTTSDDGTVVGGDLSSGSGHSAFVWTEAEGMSLLSDYLATRGLAAPEGYRLLDLYAISGDGLTFAGDALNLSTNTTEGFVATVPESPSLLLLLLPASMRRRRSAA
jgi:probable HAF family extracellular repeat protein